MRSNHKPVEPAGKHKPGQLKKVRQQQIHQPGSGRQKKPPTAPLLNEMLWEDYFYLLLKGGVCVGAAIALIYVASSMTRGITNLQNSSMLASNRTNGTRSRKSSTLAGASLFKPTETASAQLKKTVTTPPAEKPVLTSDRYKPVSLFQIIIEIQYGTGKLNEIHEVIKQQGARAMKGTVNMQGIAVPHVINEATNEIEMIDAPMITPLQYAFLIGRIDIFALLLLEGASLDGEFNFSFRSTAAKSSSDIRTSLATILFDFPFHPRVKQLCTKAFMHELFIAYLQQHNFEKPFAMMMFKLKSLHGQANKWGLPITLNAANEMFSLLPSAEYIQLSLGDVRESSYVFIYDIYYEWLLLASSAEGKRSLFMHYEPDALQAIQKQIKLYVDCFAALLKNVEKKLSRETYVNRRLARLYLQHASYPNANYKKVYLDYLNTKMDHACHVHFSDEDANEHTKIQFVASLLNGQMNLFDNDLYHECLFEIVYQKVHAYANQFPDIELATKAALMQMTDPRSEKNSVKNLMTDICQHIDNQLEHKHRLALLR